MSFVLLKLSYKGINCQTRKEVFRSGVDEHDLEMQLGLFTECVSGKVLCNRKKEFKCKSANIFLKTFGI